MPETGESLTPEQFEERLQEPETLQLGIAVQARLAIMDASEESQLPLAREWMALELDDTRNYIIGHLVFFKANLRG